MEEALPFVGVCAATLGLTLTLFDVPMEAPESARPIAASAPPSASPPVQDPAAPRRPLPAEPQRTPPSPESVPSALAPRLDALNALLAQALQTLGPKGPSGAMDPAPARGAAPSDPPAAPTVDPNFLAVVPSLSQAIQAARNARTEEDLVRAESMMHAATDQMQAACTTSGGPLCDGARQMRSLGY